MRRWNERRQQRGKDIADRRRRCDDPPVPQAGLIDELHVAIAPMLLGSGEHLLYGLDLTALGYECHASADRRRNPCRADTRSVTRAVTDGRGSFVVGHVWDWRCLTCVAYHWRLWPPPNVRTPATDALIEQVDVDVSELFAQAVGRFAHAGAAILASSASHSATPARSPMASRMPRLC